MSSGEAGTYSASDGSDSDTVSIGDLTGDFAAGFRLDAHGFPSHAHARAPPGRPRAPSAGWSPSRGDPLVPTGGWLVLWRLQSRDTCCSVGGVQSAQLHHPWHWQLRAGYEPHEKDNAGQQQQ